MSITINAKGTTVPFFKIGKTGVTFYQGSADPSLTYTMVDGDYWFDQDLNKLSVWLTNAWTAPRLADITFVDNEIAAFGGGDLVLRADGVNSRVVIQGDTGPAIITTESSQDLYIDPSLGGGGDLILIDNKWPAADGTNGQALITDGAGNLVFTTLTGTGTVTTTSVVSANGFAGSVATATTTPAITLTTTVTGVLKGNGTAISAATSGTDYSAGTSALATGILKSTTGTGALTIAVAGDFPTLNQDTTGNATTATTATNTVITDDVATGSAVYPTWVTSTTGNLPQRTSSTKLSFIPTTGILTATGFSGSGAGLTNIPNGALTNSSITIGSTNIALGATQTAFSGLTTLSMSGQLTSTLATGSPPFVVASTTPVANMSIGGSSGSTSQLTTARNISATGDASWTVSFDGSTNVSSSLTLATVNSSPQSDTFRRVTVNGKGLVTATAPVSFDNIVTALDYTPVNQDGDTMTGDLILNADPTAALGAATKQYVDNMATGIVTKPAVIAATTGNLTATYNNGTAGVGATLTSTTNGAFPAIDGVSVTTTAGQNGVLVKNQSAALQNGRYNLTQQGDGSNPWILTRCALCDTSTEIPGSYVFVTDGSQVGTGWVAIVADPATFVVGTDAITWTQFSGAGTYVAGTGINITTNTISNTGVTSAVAGTNIAVSGATGAVTFSVTGTVASASTTSITDDTTTNATKYLTWVDATSGNNAQKVTSSKLIFNPSSGALGVTGTVASVAVNINGVGLIDSATLTTSATTPGQIIDTFALATYRAASYQVSITSGSAYMYTEIKVMHNGTDTYMTETNTMLSGASLATFTTDVSGGNVRLLTTPANAVTAYRAIATMIVV